MKPQKPRGGGRGGKAKAATPSAKKKQRKRPNAKGANANGVVEKAAYQRCQAYWLRCKGRTYSEIAAELGVSRSVAHGYVNEHWEAVERQTQENADLLRRIELERMDALLAKWLPIATSEKLDVSQVKMGRGEDAEPYHIEIPDYEAGTKAAAIVLKIQERRAKLLGLDMPEKLEHSGEVAVHLTREEWKKRLEEARA